MKVTIVSKSGKELCQIETTGKIDDLKKQFQKEKKIDVNRQYFNVWKDGKKGEAIKEEIPSGVDSLVFKDLGPQISWRMVYFIEYLGPLSAFPITYLLRPYIWGADAVKPLSDVQILCFAIFVIHFIKRELETLFLHKFSRSTMPLFNLFKNSSYYSFTGWYIAYFVLHPQYKSPDLFRAQICAGIIAVLMIVNFICHKMLADLRPAGTSVRQIPKGFLFEYVSCPNYTVEILQWAVYTVMCQSVSSLVFTLMGGGQMLIWALGKHRAYRKEFPDYPRGRKALIPFLL